ncbi:MAG: helix-turn-helix domain-containing protein [Lachnospiraceae bacterium]
MKSKQILTDMHSKIFLSIYKTILLIIPLPILILIVLGMISLHLIQATAEEYKRDMVIRISEEMDRTYSNVYQMMLKVKNNTEINSYLKQKNRNYYMEYELFREISNLAAGYPQIHELYIFFPQYGYILSTAFGMDSLTYHSRYYTNTYAEWVKSMKSAVNAISFFTEARQENPNILMSGIGVDKGQRAQVVIRLEESYMNGVLENLRFHEGHEAFLLIGDTLIASTLPIEERERLAEEICRAKGEDNQSIEWEGEKYTLIWGPETSKGLTVVRAIGRSSQHSAVALVEFFSIALVLLCIITMFGIALMVAKWNYKPIKKMFGILKGDSPQDMEISYESIEGILKNRHEQHRRMEQQLREYEDDSKGLYLKNLFLGDHSFEPPLEQIASWGLGEAYYMALLYVIEAEDKASKEKELLYQELLEEYIEMFFFGKCFYVVGKGSSYYYLFNGNGSSEEDVRYRVCRQNEKMTEAIAKNEGVYFESYVSSCYDSPKKICQGYEEVERTLSAAELSAAGAGAQETICTIERIKEVIDEEIADVNLSVASLAVILKVSHSYLSRFFKQKTGKGVLEYIHIRRVEKAKQILREDGEIKIKKVAEQVGCCNITTFIRMFKKVEGIAPSEYRERLKNDDGYKAEQ